MPNGRLAHLRPLARPKSPAQQQQQHARQSGGAGGGGESGRGGDAFRSSASSVDGASGSVTSPRSATASASAAHAQASSSSSSPFSPMRRIASLFSHRRHESQLKLASLHLNANQFAWSDLGRVVGKHRTLGAADALEMDAAEVWNGRVWVGSAHAAQDVASLQRHDVRWILTVAESLCDPEPHPALASPASAEAAEDEAESEFDQQILDHAVLEVPDLPTINMLEHLDDCLECVCVPRVG